MEQVISVDDEVHPEMTRKSKLQRSNKERIIPEVLNFGFSSVTSRFFN